MKISIITNCSGRKRDIGAKPLSPDCSELQDLDQLTSLWVDLVKAAKSRVSPLDLYQGRGMAECRHASKVTKADLYIVSAGLGLVHTNDLVPNYSLTISDGNGSIQTWLTSRKASSSDWWLALNEARGTSTPIKSLINDSPQRSQFLIALPSSYLGMVVDDLATVREDRLQCIRIFTSGAGARLLPSNLRSLVMPYDDRLEGIATHNGTRTDFPHRALKHFVALLNGHRLPTVAAQEAVQLAMNSSTKRLVPKRQKATDEQIVQIVRENWLDCGGSVSKLLRFLRDEANVACEQSRFSNLWHEIKQNDSRQGVVNV